MPMRAPAVPLTLLSLTVALSFAFAVLSQTPAPVAAQSGLPGLPARWPSTLQLGLNDGPGGAAAMKGIAPFGFRYQYLSGGVNTNGSGGGNGWSTWNPNGAFATYYIQDSLNNGIVPVFTYYMIYQSGPGSGGSESDRIYNNLQSEATMRAYYNDLQLFFQRAGAFPNNLVVLHVEPDLWGYIQQRSGNDNAAGVPARVASSGHGDLAGLPNNVAGLAQGIKRLRDRYAPNVVLAYHVSVWGTGNDIIYSNPPDGTVDSLATRAGNYYRSLGTDFDIAFAEFTDRDAGFKQHVYGDGGASWWDAGDFRRNVRFLARFVQVAGERVVVWQIPFGNTRMRAMNNTWNHYQDNKVEWFLDDPGRTHLQEYLQAGVVAFLFGRGADGATCPCDANRDGVTNPAPINGNDRTSLNADDDGGYFKERAPAYYAAGAIPLGGGSQPAPTATRTPTPRPAATRTPTPLPGQPTSVPPTATSSSGTPAQLTVTFNDKAGQNQPLGGQYPAGVIDWGSGQWYHSGPYGDFTTKSVSFSGGGITSRALTLLGSRRLVSLRAYNGGGGASTVTLACAGQPTKSQSVPAGGVATIATGWEAPCASVTVTSSNGWDTNFDDLVLAS
jgi:hypothetical protein